VIVSRPAPLVLALSHAYGTCMLVPATPLRWLPCPECSRWAGKRLTVCEICEGRGRLAVFP